MAHVEPAHLVELALGNAAPGGELADALRHVEQCDHCRYELRMMTRVVTAARTAQLVDLPAAPPEHVWQRISRELSPGSAPPRPPAGPLDPARRRLLTALALALAALAAASAAAARRCRGGRP
ncbi:hypothetical protein ABZY20_05140 [Streptomyces sp. NPDC006624]|uniref:hypothetical protein n=1 Tax=unclassified Streptomyces TaxID=2593676 RepID=UPI0033AB621A